MKERNKAADVKDIKGEEVVDMKTVGMHGEMNNPNESLNIVRNESISPLPVLIPPMDKKELFNKLQESEPIGDLQGQNFKITGIIPEMVLVPNKAEEDLSDDEEIEMVERLRVTLLTDKGVYHSFSNTFNRALQKALMIFGDDFINETYTFNAKTRGSGKDLKSIYIVKAV